MAMNAEQFEEKAQQLTLKVEQNQKVSDELNDMPFQERLAMANRMDSINEEHRASDPHLPDLQIVTSKDGGDQDHLMDMIAVKKGKLWDTENDVYDMPKGVEKTKLDYLRNTQTARDVLDTNSRFAVDRDI